MTSPTPEMDRQDTKDARGLEEPAGEVDAVASSVLQACVEVHGVLGPGRVVLFASAARS
jgi:hypothetical protein